jgi:hypothetical protein
MAASQRSRATVPQDVSITARRTNPRERPVIVAPEVAARVVAAREAGKSLSEITGSLHLTPGEVRGVLA